MRSNSIHWTELEGAIRHDAMSAFRAATEGGEALGYIAGQANEIASQDAFADAGAGELHRRASGLRGCALHALTVALDMSVQAGRLAQLADVRRAVEAATGPDEGDE